MTVYHLWPHSRGKSPPAGHPQNAPNDPSPPSSSSAGSSTPAPAGESLSLG